MSRKVTNPLTGHKIQVGGGTYNNLVRQGVISQQGAGKADIKKLLNDISESIGYIIFGEVATHPDQENHLEGVSSINLVVSNKKSLLNDLQRKISGDKKLKASKSLEEYFTELANRSENDNLARGTSVMRISPIDQEMGLRVRYLLRVVDSDDDKMMLQLP